MWVDNSVVLSSMELRCMQDVLALTHVLGTFSPDGPKQGSKGSAVQLSVFQESQDLAPVFTAKCGKWGLEVFA